MCKRASCSSGMVRACIIGISMTAKAASKHKAAAIRRAKPAVFGGMIAARRDSTGLILLMVRMVSSVPIKATNIPHEVPASQEASWWLAMKGCQPIRNWEVSQA